MSHADATIAVVGLMLAAANPHFSRRVGQVRASRRCVSASRVRCWPHAVTLAKRFPANEDPPTHGLARRTLHRGEKCGLTGTSRSWGGAIHICLANCEDWGILVSLGCGKMDRCHYADRTGP